ncbi:MAG: hypothetical protein ACI9CB_002440 [Rhodothermales bacterium]|jgi:hypothetical protein
MASDGVKGSDGVRVKCQSEPLWHLTLTPVLPVLALITPVVIDNDL